MRRCDYCGKVAEYDGQPHGIEDCAEHLRLENVRLRNALRRIWKGPQAKHMSYTKSPEMYDWICRAIDIAGEAITTKGD